MSRTALRSFQLSIPADKDLDDIFDYTSDQFGIQQAVTYISSFESVFENLVLFPESGRSRDEIRKGLRSISHEKHIVFYRIKKDMLLIIRVLHVSRDIKQFLL